MNTSAFSPLVAGTMTWGVWGKNLSVSRMADLIRTCLDLGISSFDHADIYGHYSTEAAFGQAFRNSGLARNAIQLISKCGIQLESAERKSIVKHYDYSRAHIIGSVEQSLRNLQTDYLDLFLLHRPSPLLMPAEVAEAVEQLRKAGKIREFGVSNFTPSQTDLIQSHTRVQYNQIEFSLSKPEALTNGSLDHMQESGIRPMAWAPLGTVFNQSDPASTRILSLAGELGEKYSVSPEAILLAWILRHPAEIIPVFGSTDPARIARLQQASTVQLELQDWFRLWTAATGKEVP